MLYPVAVLLFFDISAGELMVILLVAFLIFGPSKIPEIARKIGRGLSEVRRASDEIKREITKESKKLEDTLSVDDLDPSKTKPNQEKNKKVGAERGDNSHHPGENEDDKKDSAKSTS
jgi:TatA/E family protein of Tat protein translocase